MLTLDELDGRVRELAQRIGVPAHLLPAIGRSADRVAPHVEIVDGGYRYVEFERGTATERRIADDDEVLYRVFDHLTARMPTPWAAERLRRGDDLRGAAYARQVELMRTLSPAWGERMAAEVERRRSVHPFPDVAADG